MPAAFRDRLEGWLVDAEGASREAALDAALRALWAALTPEGRERRGAFDLLSGDALVTRACEAATGEDDPEAALSAVLSRLVRTLG